MPVELRVLTAEDLAHLWTLMYRHQEWKRYDAPYYPLQAVPLDRFLASTSVVLQDHSWKGIWIDGELQGMVSFYFEDEDQHWLEAGLVIYDPQLWGKGHGTAALTAWISELFERFRVPRVGLTTWSGNPRMVRAALRLGFTMEGQLRKVRHWEGEHYDSVRLGVLREEWEALHPPTP